MAWIETIAYADADARLRRVYDKAKGPDGTVDNVLAVHSLRPHTMEGHIGLYGQVLHSPANTVPKWFLEALGVWVSALNGCTYCETHHFRGMSRLLKDADKAAAIKAAITAQNINAAPLEDAQKAALRYAEVLTRAPQAVTRSHIDALRAAGWSDGEILEINQVCAYFSYANRTVLGLGCALESEG